MGYNNYSSVKRTGEYSFLKNLGQTNPRLCIDIGANKGNYSKLLLEKTGSSVIAFEPLPKAYAELLELEGRYGKRFRSYNYGVGEKCEELTLYFGSEDSELASFSTEINEIAYVSDSNINSIKVKVISLDSFFENNALEIDSIDLIKIDTEGYELEVLRGAKNTIGRLKPKFIQIENNWHQLFRNNSIFGFSSILPGYAIYRLLPYGGMTPVDSRSPLSNIFLFSNYIFVRNDLNL